MTFWIDVFTVETWNEARSSNFSVSGFRLGRRAFARKVAPGDVFLCYLGGGVGRWVGAFRVVSDLYEAESPRVWKSDVFPLRFRTEPIATLTPEQAIPVDAVRDRLEMFRQLANQRAWGFLFQGSPSQIQQPHDGEVLLEAITAAVANPIERPIVRAGGSSRGPKPAKEPPNAHVIETTTPPPEPLTPADERAHTEIQYLLLKLGSDLGLSVWAARNDRRAAFRGQKFEDIPRLARRLPEQFDPRTQQIVELIDVLWIERDGIRCAFEVENSTNVYGGLLRMSDLLSRRPNLEIALYIVAPDERFQKVRDELNRPTFAMMRKPLVEVCKFIPYSALRERVQRWGQDVVAMRPESIDLIAQSCRID